MSEMEKTIVRVAPAGPLAKRADGQQKLAVGLGGVGAALTVLHLFHPGFLALAAGIGAMILTWDAVTNRDRRTALATGAFALGAVPVALEAFLLVGVVLKIAILAGIAAGVYFGGRALYSKLSDKTPEPPADPV